MSLTQREISIVCEIAFGGLGMARSFETETRIRLLSAKKQGF